MKKIILTTLLAIAFNSHSLANVGLNKEVFENETPRHNNQVHIPRDKLIKDSERMTIEQLEQKYNEEEVNHIKRINEVYGDKNIKNKKNFVIKDKLKGVE